MEHQEGKTEHPEGVLGPELAARLSGHPRPVVPVPDAIARLEAAVLEHLPGPLLTRDNLRSMEVPNVCDAPFPERFGFAPSSLESVLPQYLAVGVTMVAVDLVVMGLYTGLSVRLVKWLHTPRKQTILNRVFSGLFATAAVVLSLVRRGAATV